MEIPVEWNVFILPGIIILASIILCRDFKDIYTIIKGEHSALLGGTVIFGLIGYLIGFLGNSIGLIYLKTTILNCMSLENIESPPPADMAVIYYLGHSEMIKAIEGSYNLLVLYRSLTGSFFLSVIPLVIGTILRKDKLIRVAIILLFLAAGFTIKSRWVDQRGYHKTFIQNSISLAKSSVANKDSVFYPSK